MRGGSLLCYKMGIVVPTLMLSTVITSHPDLWITSSIGDQLSLHPSIYGKLLHHVYFLILKIFYFANNHAHEKRRRSDASFPGFSTGFLGVIGKQAEHGWFVAHEGPALCEFPPWMKKDDSFQVIYRTLLWQMYSLYYYLFNVNDSFICFNAVNSLLS